MAVSSVTTTTATAGMATRARTHVSCRAHQKISTPAAQNEAPMNAALSGASIGQAKNVDA